jgi:choline dehydrogenase
VFQPRGKVLAIELDQRSFYVRGQHEDYDRWRQRQCRLALDDVLPLFQEGGKPDARRRHRRDGPLSVSDWRHADPLSEASPAAVEAGIPFNRSRRDAGRRWLLPDHDAARPAREQRVLISRPAKGRGNLHIETSAPARRLVSRPPRARRRIRAERHTADRGRARRSWFERRL